MGTFIVFLIGLPGHSEPMVDSARLLVRQLIQLMLVFLGLSTPTVQRQAPVSVATTPPVVMHAKRVHPTVIKVVPNSMFLNNDPALHRFTYLFEGKTTLHDQPCPNASVLVRMISGDRTVTKGTVTNTDGTYSLEVAIDAEDMAPVDWTMEAYTPDFKKVELSGRRIVQREEEQEKKPIIVTNPVEFIVSFSK